VQLADKHRPATLADIAGNAKAIGILKALVARPMPSAWLLEGPSGIGKSSAALAVARALASDMDVQHVAGQDIGAADVRRIYEALNHSAWKPGGWKVCIVDEADQISRQGQTLWLSYLEKLPPHAIVIFTSNERGDFEPRFLSRVKTLHFTAQGMAEAGAKRLETVAAAEGVPLEHAVAVRLMRAAGNNVRAALHALELEVMSVAAA